MPMNYGKYHEIEARIQVALQELSNDPDLNIAEAARNNHVPYLTIAFELDALAEHPNQSEKVPAKD